MSLIILNDWFINEDKSITYYDTIRVVDFSTGNKKSVVPASSLSAVAGTDNEPKSVMMYEHHIAFQGGKRQVFESSQFEGYQLSYKQGKNYYTFAMPRGRRRRVTPTATAVPEVTTVAPSKKGEKQHRVISYAQTQDEVEILLGLKEAPPVDSVVEPTEPVVELTEPVVELTEPVVELTEIVSQ